MQHTTPLRRYYKNAEFAALQEAAWDARYPLWIRRKGSRHKPAEQCLGPIDFIATADLFFDDYPDATLEILQGRKR